MKKFLIVILTALSIFIISGCSNLNKDVNNINEINKIIKISAVQAKEEMKDSNTIVLDVRSQEEYNNGHIENSILIPIDNLEDDAETKLINKDQKILIYCRSGNRSEKAADLLLQMGYTNIYDFGGINDWPYELVK
ncbi:rhodanese-like domain-containing protein [Clostridium nigeriense]|uniref:rhodanese-like domain-containing protein n=1 Tax=Clostridium nigeriense TaxID=1805470 RepID=UPI000829C3BD|nr:rhodanese-like domain-containing protein [Clostridium nigeriense]